MIHDLVLHVAMQEISPSVCGDGRFNLLYTDYSMCNRCAASPGTRDQTRPGEAASTSHQPNAAVCRKVINPILHMTFGILQACLGLS